MPAYKPKDEQRIALDTLKKYSSSNIKARHIRAQIEAIDLEVAGRREIMRLLALCRRVEQYYTKSMSQK